MSSWRLADIPDLSGKVAIVTGGNVGLGFASCVELARQRAHMVIACRDPVRGEEALTRLRDVVPEADASFLRLDLVDPESIARFADDYATRFDRLDILLNNAGVVNLETLRRTPAGDEMHLATNHLGHFALTGRLFPRLCETDGARVVTVSSLGHRGGEIRFDDLDWTTRDYDRVSAYGDSKLANLWFMWTLEARFRARGTSAISVAAHPGLTGTERQQSIGIGGAITRWLASPVAKGVRSQLQAAVDPDVSGGEFYRPRFGVLGPSSRVDWAPAMDEAEALERLWTWSEERTGVAYPR